MHVASRRLLLSSALWSSALWALTLYVGCAHEPDAQQDLAAAPDSNAAEDLSTASDLAAPDLALDSHAPDLALADLAVADLLSSPPNVVFVTSTMVTPPLGATGTAALAAADAVCQARASAAGLGGTYVAWLSTSTVNARDRLGTARGWVRPDGKPFADTVAALTAGQVYYPPVLDETGAISGNLTLTGATPSGGLANWNCVDWTSGAMSDSYNIGVPYAAGSDWAENAGHPCTTRGSLYCFGVDRQAVVAPPPFSSATGRLVFISSASFSPSGATTIADADAICAAAAASASLAGAAQFQALLSSSTQSAVEHTSLGSGKLPVRADGALIAADLAKFASGTWLTGITTAPNGTYQSTANAAWTGSTTPGTRSASGESCGDWTSATGNAVWGVPSFVEWKLSTYACTTLNSRLYCIGP